MRPFIKRNSVLNKRHMLVNTKTRLSGARTRACAPTLCEIVQTAISSIFFVL